MYRILGKLLAPAAVGALAAVLAAGTAFAAPSTPAHSAHSAAPQVTCSSNPKQNGEVVASNSYIRGTSLHNLFTTTIQLWYSPTCRTVWAKEVNGIGDDYFWVFNKDTNVESKAFNPATTTAAIDDANTQSHACMENDGIENNETMPKTCTSYF